jgi:hypothetical protein
LMRLTSIMTASPITRRRLELTTTAVPRESEAMSDCFCKLLLHLSNDSMT